jgi:hypothetical protein
MATRHEAIRNITDWRQRVRVASLIRVPEIRLSTLLHWSVVVSIAVLVGSYYLWEVRAAGYRFDWELDQGGYYNYLARAFAHGRLELPITPSPELLAQPNPWDPAVKDTYRMHDMVLFNGRYYLYHGPGPAVLLFTPWLKITGHDLPERFALFLLCFGAFLFSCGTLTRLLALAGAKANPALLAVMLLALGICQSVPYLLMRVWVYEIAIAGGYFCISGAIYFLVQSMESERSVIWLGASGLMFGLAVSCRPHLGMAAAIAFAGLVILRLRSRSLADVLRSADLGVFVAGVAAIGAAVAAYNYQRFGNPFEFGLRYLLAGPNQNRIKLASEFLWPGFYFWLACPPDVSPVFPWVRLAFRPPFNSPDYPFPLEYFIEPTVGALWLAPFIPAAFILLFIRRRARDLVEKGSTGVRTILWILVASSAAVLVFLAATGFTTQRYEVDFLPCAVLAAVACFGIFIHQHKGVRRAVAVAVLLIATVSGIIVNAALGMSGPYDEMLKNRPVSYLRIARWFSPLEQYRLIMNPAVSASFTAEFGPRHDGFYEPLLTMGHSGYPYFLYVEHADGKLRLVSRSEKSTVRRDMSDAETRRSDIRFAYDPASGKVTTSINGREFLSHDAGVLVTAPAQVTIGENRIAPAVCAERFTGRIYGETKTVGPAGAIAH